MTYDEYAKMILDSLATNADKKQCFSIGSLSTLVEISCTQLDNAYNTNVDRDAMKRAFTGLLPRYPQLSFTGGIWETI